MCGIAGFWRVSRAGSADDIIGRMNTSLAHRGPDGQGRWTDPLGTIALGHRRLAIVDLSETGQQPMWSSSGRFVIVFNGEIYNFRSLRRELEGHGDRFVGSSDTEVMLACFERYGVAKAVPMLSGMFAFAVFDVREQQLWVCRDRLGEKPLYLANDGQQCVLASELKAIMASGLVSRDIDPVATAQVLRYGYIPAPQSIYRHVSKLYPGELLCLQRTPSGTLTSTRTRYWEPVAVAHAQRGDSLAMPEQGVDLIASVLGEVVGEHMLADVPVGAFLSGGIDSSLVVALMRERATRPIRTFTIAFSEATHDESVYAKAIAAHLGTEHCEIRLSAHAALDAVAQLPTLYDEPFADSSQLPTWLVARETRQHVTVALTGDGGDELFGGYSQYTAFDRVGQLIRQIPAAARPVVGMLLSGAPPALLIALIARTGGSGWPSETRERLLRGLRSANEARLYEDRHALWIDPMPLLRTALPPESARLQLPGATWPDGFSEIERMMLYDSQGYLPGDILAKVDRASMANSLETRAPLLDHRVFEAAWQLPLAAKVGPAGGKLVLRDLLSRHVPKTLFDRPKQGFSIPLAGWLRRELKGWGDDLIRFAGTGSSPLRQAPLDEVWQAHQRGACDHSARLWSALVLLQWFQHHQ